MKEEDLLRLVWVADPQISPDGTRMAFTRVAVDPEADAYTTQVWWVEVPAPGHGSRPPRPLTFGPLDSQPRWSPDGLSLAFVRATEPKKPGQLFVLPMT